MVFTPNRSHSKFYPKRVKKKKKEKISLLYKDSSDYVQKTLNFMNGEQYEEKDWHNFLFTTKLLDNPEKKRLKKHFLYYLI